MGSEMPWQSFSRDVLPRSLRYPLRQSDIAAGLIVVGVHLDRVSLVRPQSPVRPEAAYLVIGEIWGNSRSSYTMARGQHSQTVASLNVLAVPTSATISAAQVTEELVFVAGWLKAGLGRGNAWLANDHRVYSILTPDGVERRA